MRKVMTIAKFMVGFFLSIMAIQTVAADKPLPKEELRRFLDIFSVAQSDYVIDVDDAKVFAGCFNGMLHALDDRSAYLDSETFRELRDSVSSGEQASLGLQVRMKAGTPYVIGVFDDSPASRAGIRLKDYLLSVDGESTEDMDLSAVVRKLRGPVGSSIELTVRRFGEIADRRVSLTREVIKQQTIKTAILDYGIGYMRVNRFDSNVAGDVRSTFLALQKKNNSPLKGLVLDLRDSPGGVLIPLSEVAAMFLQKDVVMYSTEGRLKDANLTVYASRDFLKQFRQINPTEWPDELAAVPLVVLVNDGTASGAEIVASALQENKRALLMGRKTQGIGSVQTVRQLSADTAIKLTTAYYKTPSGKTIHGKGIIPDIELSQQEPTPSSPQSDVWVRQAIAQLIKAR